MTPRDVLQPMSQNEATARAIHRAGAASNKKSKLAAASSSSLTAGAPRLGFQRVQLLNGTKVVPFKESNGTVSPFISVMEGKTIGRTPNGKPPPTSHVECGIDKHNGNCVSRKHLQVDQVLQDELVISQFPKVHSAYYIRAGASFSSMRAIGEQGKVHLRQNDIVVFRTNDEDPRQQAQAGANSSQAHVQYLYFRVTPSTSTTTATPKTKAKSTSSAAAAVASPDSKKTKQQQQQKSKLSLGAPKLSRSNSLNSNSNNKPPASPLLLQQTSLQKFAVSPTTTTSSSNAVVKPNNAGAAFTPRKIQTTTTTTSSTTALSKTTSLSDKIASKSTVAARPRNSSSSRKTPSKRNHPHKNGPTPQLADDHVPQVGDRYRIFYEQVGIFTPKASSSKKTAATTPCWYFGTVQDVQKAKHNKYNLKIHTDDLSVRAQDHELEEKVFPHKDLQAVSRLDDGITEVLYGTEHVVLQAATAPDVSLAVGDLVVANFQRAGAWHRGRIAKLHHSADKQVTKCDIAYQDGDYETEVPLSSIKVPEDVFDPKEQWIVGLAVGAKVVKSIKPSAKGAIVQFEKGSNQSYQMVVGKLMQQYYNQAEGRRYVYPTAAKEVSTTPSTAASSPVRSTTGSVDKTTMLLSNNTNVTTTTNPRSPIQGKQIPRIMMPSASKEKSDVSVAASPNTNASVEEESSHVKDDSSYGAKKAKTLTVAKSASSAGATTSPVSKKQPAKKREEPMEVSEVSSSPTKKQFVGASSSKADDKVIVLEEEKVPSVTVATTSGGTKKRAAKRELEAPEVSSSPTKKQFVDASSSSEAEDEIMASEEEAITNKSAMAKAIFAPANYPSCSFKKPNFEREPPAYTVKTTRPMKPLLLNTFQGALNGTEPHIGAILLTAMTSSHHAMPSDALVKDLIDTLTFGPKASGQRFSDSNRCSLTMDYMRVVLSQPKMYDRVVNVAGEDYWKTVLESLGDLSYCVDGDEERDSDTAQRRIIQSLRLQEFATEFLLLLFEKGCGEDRQAMIRDSLPFAVNIMNHGTKDAVVLATTALARLTVDQHKALFKPVQETLLENAHFMRVRQLQKQLGIIISFLLKLLEEDSTLSYDLKQKAELFASAVDAVLKEAVGDNGKQFPKKLTDKLRTQIMLCLDEELVPSINDKLASEFKVTKRWKAITGQRSHPK